VRPENCADGADTSAKSRFAESADANPRGGCKLSPAPDLLAFGVKEGEARMSVRRRGSSRPRPAGSGRLLDVRDGSRSACDTSGNDANPASPDDSESMLAWRRSSGASSIAAAVFGSDSTAASVDVGSGALGCGRPCCAMKPSKKSAKAAASAAPASMTGAGGAWSASGPSWIGIVSIFPVWRNANSRRRAQAAQRQCVHYLLSPATAWDLSETLGDVLGARSPRRHRDGYGGQADRAVRGSPEASQPAPGG